MFKLNFLLEKDSPPDEIKDVSRSPSDIKSTRVSYSTFGITLPTNVHQHVKMVSTQRLLVLQI